MKIVASTDLKYLGTDISPDVQVGDTLVLGDFNLYVEFIKYLEDNRIALGNNNYILTLEE